MKIAIDGLNIRKGGGQTVLVRLAEAFARNGIDVLVFSATDSLIDDVTKSGSPHIAVLKVQASLSAAGSLLYRYRNWDRECIRHNCDSVLSFNYWTPSRLPQATYHINVIPYLPLTERIKAVGKLRAIIQRNFALQALKKSDINLFESHHVLELAQSVTPDIRKADVAYIGVDFPSDITQPPAKQPYFVAVTSPSPHKHNEHLFALHRALNAGRDPARRIGLKLIGVTLADLNQVPASAQEMDYASSQSDVEFLGYIDRAKLYTELAGALALVSFSELESFYMVALEAMAARCPTVTTDISSVRESVGTAGLTSAPGDIEGFAAHINSLENTTLRDAIIERGIAHSAAFEAKDCANNIVEKIKIAMEQ